jgi:UDP-2,3-diacylglucosamine pyrophosphatase LpxH
MAGKTYEDYVAEALEKTYQHAIAQEEQALSISMDLPSARYIIFSDHHKGIRNRADDFRKAERAYNAALAYYFRMGHRLVILGDAEELWEEQPAQVIKTYKHTLGLEAQFHLQGRYLRFWGNHDDDWQFKDAVKSHLTPIFGEEPPLNVYEGLRIKVMENGESLGSLFLAHGHQGTTASDRWAWFSKFFVRYLWRPYQRITGTSLNTPAEDWALRQRHNIALYRWAARQEKLVLIAGHTHRPVFASMSHPARIEEHIQSVEAKIIEHPEDRLLREQVALLYAELEWVRAQEEQATTGAEGYVPLMSKPCYFNTGCCSFSDGDITGIEIFDGDIRLIRFPDYKNQPQPEVLQSAPLKQVLALS